MNEEGKKEKAAAAFPHFWHSVGLTSFTLLFCKLQIFFISLFFFIFSATQVEQYNKYSCKWPGENVYVHDVYELESRKVAKKW